MSESDNRAARQNKPGSAQSPDRQPHDRPSPERQTPDALAQEALATETRMRRALGLSPGASPQTPQQRPEQARARHRFVQDGGVPVVMLSHKPDPDAALRERIGALEGQLETERAAHATARRLLAEQQAAHQALQTRLVHAELAHTEAVETERRKRLAAQQALADLQAAPPRRAKVTPQSQPDAAPTLPAIEMRPSKPKLGTPPADKPKRGRPRIHPIPEPKPVRWWTPSFKAKTKA